MVDVRITLSALFFSFSSVPVLAGSRQDCEQVVRAFGYPVAPYSHVEEGLFRMEQHLFGDLICYVDDEDQIDSLYRGSIPIAEDGYFGEEALRERNRIINTAEQQIEAARANRDAQIELAHSTFSAAQGQYQAERDEQLADLQASSDPFRTDTEEAVSDLEEPTPAPEELVEISTSTDPSAPSSASHSTDMWVRAAQADVRSCPSASCGRLNLLVANERLTVFEERDGWGRVSESYFASCVNGSSSLIKEGDARCEPANGIVDGRLAGWVHLEGLSAEAPPPQLVSAAPPEADISPPSPAVFVTRDMWVTAETLRRRTCPSTTCGSVAVFRERQKLTVLEERDGWGRVTEPRSASCVGGISRRVDEGNNRCVPDNGIVDGQYSEWVSLAYLSTEEPRRIQSPSRNPTGVSSSPTQSAFYRNCSAARAAGAAPIRRGQPGYRSRLDRDNDGVACE